MKQIWHALDCITDFLRDWWWLILIAALAAFGAYVTAKDPGYKIINIDGCEYIKSTTCATTPVVHKANCKNHHE